MMIHRQRALIRLIANEGGKVSKLRLVKLSFLLRKNSKGMPKSNLYEFVPYHFGPYSFTLNYELRVMERNGLLNITDSQVELRLPIDGDTLKLGSEFAWKSIF